MLGDRARVIERLVFSCRAPLVHPFSLVRLAEAAGARRDVPLEERKVSILSTAPLSITVETPGARILACTWSSTCPATAEAADQVEGRQGAFLEPLLSTKSAMQIEVMLAPSCLAMTAHYKLGASFTMTHHSAADSRTK